MPLIALLFMVLNLIAFVGAGLWLAVLGYWKIVFLGIALGLSGAFFVSVLLAPSLLLIAPLMSERVSNSRMAALPIAALSLVYTYAVMGIWALTIFWFFSGMAAPAAALPVVLWSYSTATGVSLDLHGAKRGSVRQRVQYALRLFQSGGMCCFDGLCVFEFRSSRAK
jgi:hypothetical protein